MKLTTIIVAMLIGCICYGQKYAINAQSIRDATRKTDTVRVIMLVCDTMHRYGMQTYEWRGDTMGIKKNYYYIEKTWWQFGYKVLEGPMIYRYHNDGSKTPLFKVTEYLDERKRPLPKSIIVWMSTTLSQ